MTLPRLRCKVPSLDSLKARLLLCVIVPIAMISVVDLFVSYNNADHIATLAQDQLLKGASRIIAEQLEKSGESYEINVPPAAFELLANEYHDRVYFSVRSKSGLLIAGDEELPVDTGELRAEEEKYGISAIHGQ
ncbi:MAG TPA: sensor histidine kinase N-terminal domain-containing protein, partial [Burkholderiaceae bacterium]|nr:sensor histidine kinase N-terminal domain-containing protein [Burkholderiaceae bacterium]